jgi:hypothetical protein
LFSVSLIVDPIPIIPSVPPSISVSRPIGYRVFPLVADSCFVLVRSRVGSMWANYLLHAVVVSKVRNILEKKAAYSFKAKFL